MRIIISFILCLFCLVSFSQDTVFLKVHFLYGSKPLKKYRDTEDKWFGGILGGHVGIEVDQNQILNFLPNGEFHWFAQDKNRHSTYAVHSEGSFYSILGSVSDSVKKTIVLIPITEKQKQLFDSISSVYLRQTPYDYAFWGMRCGAATYDILGQLGIVENYSYRKTYRKIFYPKKLRKRLFRKAEKFHWTILRKEGSLKRKWEQD